jgi:hypothetical protein
VLSLPLLLNCCRGQLTSTRRVWSVQGVRTWHCDEGTPGQPKWLARTVSVKVLQERQLDDLDLDLSSQLAGVEHWSREHERGSPKKRAG